MNKQIEHLFNEAGFHKPEMERLGIEHKFEKFAELIVRECIVKYDEWAEESSDQTSFRMARHNVKKHFGVEP